MAEMLSEKWAMYNNKGILTAMAEVMDRAWPGTELALRELPNQRARSGSLPRCISSAPPFCSKANGQS